MPQLVTMGAMMSCSFGLAPSTLTVLPANRVMSGNKPAANILDSKPIVNIAPFGMCNTPSNPAVATATAAASGVLTPVPCVPVTPAPWAPGAPRTMIANMPALTNASTCTCTWGGVITITNAGQMTVNAS